MQPNNTPNFQVRTLPSFGYFVRILFRHGPWAILITLPIAVLIFLGLSRIEITYRSAASVIYDPRDNAITNTYGLYPEFTQIGNIFIGALQDKASLSAVGWRVDYFDIESPAYIKPWHFKFLAQLVPKTLTPQSWSYDEEEYKAHAIQNQIKTKLQGFVNAGSYQLELAGRASTPEAAEALVTAALDTFVEFQLRETLEKKRQI